VPWSSILIIYSLNQKHPWYLFTAPIFKVKNARKRKRILLPSTDDWYRLHRTLASTCINEVRASQHVDILPLTDMFCNLAQCQVIANNYSFMQLWQADTECALVISCIGLFHFESNLVVASDVSNNARWSWLAVISSKSWLVWSILASQHISWW